jgi:hypothetical protein
MAVPTHDGNRHFMLKWSAAKKACLLSAQPSALSPYFFRHPKSDTFITGHLAMQAKIHNLDLNKMMEKFPICLISRPRHSLTCRFL